MLHDYRPDLRARFDLTSKEGRGEFIVWADAHLRSSTEGLSLGEALASQAAPSKKGVRRVYKAKIALSGSWTDTSGRGEDIRGSAKALDALGFRDYIVVDLVGEVCLTPHGKALEPETYIEVNVNIVHTNADTTVENAFLLKRLNVHAQKRWAFGHGSLNGCRPTGGTRIRSTMKSGPRLNSRRRPSCAMTHVR